MTDEDTLALLAMMQAARTLLDVLPDEGASNRRAYTEHGMLCDKKREIGPCDCGLTEYEAAREALQAALKKE
jgi:hypothetical protein